ncbi:MAG: helix-turn-helix transcriptional regulator [Nitrospirales bacterium]
MGNKLKAELEKRRMTQQELASLLMISRQAVSQLVKRQLWNAKTIKMVSEALGKPMPFWFKL